LSITLQIHQLSALNQQTFQRSSYQPLQSEIIEEKLEHFIQPISSSFVPSLDRNKEAKEIAALLQHVLPDNTFVSLKTFVNWIQSHLPFSTWRLHYPSRCRHSIVLLCNYSPEFKQEELFLELLKSYPFLYQKFSLFSFHCHRFYLSGYIFQRLLLIESVITTEDQKILEDLRNYLPMFAETVSSGCQSSKAIQHTFLSTLIARSHRPVSSTQTLLCIQQRLMRWIKRFADQFDIELFDDLARFLSLSSPLYWQQRSHTHISRLIITQFWLQKKMQRALLGAPEKRHLFFRFLPTNIESPFERKPVLGLLITLALFSKHESFDEEHLLTAIRKWIPEISWIQSSRYLHRNPQDDRFCTLYLELDKKNGTYFSLKEKKDLSKKLTLELKGHVQKLMPSVFVRRNEEQIMKSIIILSQELKSPRSLPQMKLFFEKQTDKALIFTVILVYLTKRKYASIQKKISQIEPLISVSLERKDIIGYLPNKACKEVSIFRIQLSKKNDLFRKDFSVDIYKARQKIVNVLNAAFGEIRDYEGGLFLKQQEQLSRLQEQFPHLDKGKNDLLESFFYSITPIEKQATLPSTSLAALFSLILSSLKAPLVKKDSYIFKQEEIGSNLLVCIRTSHTTLKKHLHDKLQAAVHLKKKLITTSFSFEETSFWGFILESNHPKLRSQWLDALHETVFQWQKEQESYQVLRLRHGSYPISLDPRLAGDRVSKAIVQMLFEGLMRMTSEMKAEPAMAESVDISSDLKTYVFRLRHCHWSNGTLIHAQDFEYAWKKMLSPNFDTPFALFLYPIKNARKAKQGTTSPNHVGIHVINDLTLQVELEYPVPYFLELMTLPFFFPINAALDKAHPQWAMEDNENFICNGPFFLKKNHKGELFELEKNLLHWDELKIHFHKVVFSKANTHTALEMFKNKELDWLGRPFRPWDASFQTAQTEETEVLMLSQSVYWCSLSVNKFPFNCLKLRRALSLALNRKEIVKMLQDESQPAFSPLPFQHAHFPFYGVQTGEPALAKVLFRQALNELGLTPQTFPMIHLIYPAGERRAKIAQCISRQWQEIFGIDVFISECVWPVLFKKMTEGDYEIACVTWCPYLDNPQYTLGVFTRKEEGLNFPKWENKEFYDLMMKAIYEPIVQTRENYLAHAEAVLIKECPIIPIIYERYKAIKYSSLKAACFKESDYIDFRNVVRK
jgi:oligopeptide transport system substrate-binding protein